MHLIVGLGNPGDEYITTRHNVGFLALDYFVSRHLDSDVSFRFDKKFNANLLNTLFVTQKILCLKPNTFMNNSGVSVLTAMKYFDISIENIIILYDEVDLPFGELRESGTSAAGHKGMQSVIDHLSDDRISRVRVGVRNELREKMETSDFVLSSFSKQELSDLEKTIFPEVSEKIISFLS